MTCMTSLDQDPAPSFSDVPVFPGGSVLLICFSVRVLRRLWKPLEVGPVIRRFRHPERNRRFRWIRKRERRRNEELEDDERALYMKWVIVYIRSHNSIHDMMYLDHPMGVHWRSLVLSSPLNTHRKVLAINSLDLSYSIAPVAVVANGQCLFQLQFQCVAISKCKRWIPLKHGLDTIPKSYRSIEKSNEIYLRNGIILEVSLLVAGFVIFLSWLLDDSFQL